MTTLSNLLVCFSAALLLAGCAAVHVVDTEGNPIPNAEVTSTSMSMGTGPNLTDANGNAQVPSNVQGTKWITVTCKGYKMVTIDVPPQYPITITLNKE